MNYSQNKINYLEIEKKEVTSGKAS